VDDLEAALPSTVTPVSDRTILVSLFSARAAQAVEQSMDAASIRADIRLYFIMIQRPFRLGWDHYKGET